jgi:hypothetical protein
MRMFVRVTVRVRVGRNANHVLGRFLALLQPPQDLH